MEKKTLMVGVLIGLIMGVLMGVTLVYNTTVRELQAESDEMQTKYDLLVSQWNNLESPFINFHSEYDWAKSDYELGIITPLKFLNELEAMLDSYIANVTAPNITVTVEGD